MKNKKMTNNVKADPIVQLLFAKTSIEFLSKNIAEFSKTPFFFGNSDTQ